MAAAGFLEISAELLILSCFASLSRKTRAEKTITTIVPFFPLAPILPLDNRVADFAEIRSVFREKGEGNLHRNYVVIRKGRLPRDTRFFFPRASPSVINHEGN